MSEKPILFNTDMVRAILDGRKTQTRRVVVPPYRDGDAGFNVITNATTGKFLYIEYYDEDESSTERRLNPPYIPGDVLWVRETWAHVKFGTGDWHYEYRADCEDQKKFSNGSFAEWRPSIHMPRKAARIFLRVTNVRCEQVQDITNADAKSEGVMCATDNSGIMHRFNFRFLWDSITDESTNWNANPWVWVYEFERIKP